MYFNTTVIHFFSSIRLPIKFIAAGNKEIFLFIYKATDTAMFCDGLHSRLLIF